MALRWGGVGGLEDQLDAATRPLQPLSDQAGMVIAGIVGEDVDPLLSGVVGLQLLEQRDGRGGVDPLGLDQGAVEILQIERACVFRGDPASDSDNIRPPVPIL